MLNWGLMRHPANWLTVFLMLAFAAFAVDILSRVASAANPQNP